MTNYTDYMTAQMKKTFEVRLYKINSKTKSYEYTGTKFFKDQSEAVAFADSEPRAYSVIDGEDLFDTKLSIYYG